jgi:hypothetical protein
MSPAVVCRIACGGLGVVVEAAAAFPGAFFVGDEGVGVGLCPIEAKLSNSKIKTDRTSMQLSFIRPTGY